MLKLISQMTIQCIFLVLSQVFLKFGMNKVEKRSIDLALILDILKNYYFWLAGLSMAISAVIWMVVLKKNDFNVAYPLISISYIFGLIAAVFIFHENVPLVRWVGVAIIILGIVITVQK